MGGIEKGLRHAYKREKLYQKVFLHVANTWSWRKNRAGPARSLHTSPLRHLVPLRQGLSSGESFLNETLSTGTCGFPISGLWLYLLVFACSFDFVVFMQFLFNLLLLQQLRRQSQDGGKLFYPYLKTSSLQRDFLFASGSGT